MKKNDIEQSEERSVFSMALLEHLKEKLSLPEDLGKQLMGENSAFSIEFWKLPKVKEVTGRSKAAIYGDDDFPKPVKLGLRSSAWVNLEVIAWQAKRIAERDCRVA